MGIKSFTLSALLVATSLIQVGCGGSSDDGAGGPVSLSVFPNTKTLTATVAAETDGCASGDAGDFMITGGTAPYTLTIADPALVSVSTSKVSNRNGLFTVFYTTTACMTSQITIRDELGSIIVLTLVSTQKVVTP